MSLGVIVCALNLFPAVFSSMQSVKLLSTLSKIDILPTWRSARVANRTKLTVHITPDSLQS